MGLSISIWVLVGCTSIGPHPQMFAMDAEIEAVEEVKSILVIPTTGTGTNNPKANINIAVPGSAYRRYENALLTQDGISRTVKTLKMPRGTALALPRAWQVAFYDWIQNFKKNPKATPTLKLTTPKRPKKIPSNKDVKKLVKSLSSAKKGIMQIAKVSRSGDMEKISAVVKKNKKAVAKMEALNAHLIERLNIGYFILSHFEGDEKIWESGDPMRLYVAMINPVSGRFRYFAVTEMDKSSAPTDYKGLINITAINMFDDLAGIDDLDIIE